jgi:ApbE superfamily uncharacterized protein (UPF0280 family)
MQRAQAHWLSDGRRLHLHHGPIDMIVDVTGPGRQAALTRAVARFDTLLSELVAELPRLRAPHGPTPTGETAQRMLRAVAPFAPDFITPMAAVAGAGAETILAAICDGPGVDRAYVNNGGDVAFHIGPGETMRAAIAGDPPGAVLIRADNPVRGIATSGAGGRSHSLGIADSVTVLARNAALADAAATMIANAVDLPGHPAITRQPAHDIAPDSDLGDRPVTTRVGHLSDRDVAHALGAGATYAEDLRERGLISGAALILRGRTCLVGTPYLIQQKEPEHA